MADDDDDNNNDEVHVDEDEEESNKKKNHRKYRRDKPWDTDDIDHWSTSKWDPTNGDTLAGGHLLEESSFATLFPKYRERYLRDVWPLVTKSLDGVGIACELNLIEGSMTVRTTKRTSDPYIVLKARDLIKLLARSIPAPQALKVLDDDVHCDIVKIGGLVRNKSRFAKRRQRLVGPDGATLKALELLTQCFVLVQGNTVSIMGNHRGIKQARRVVLDCMNNIHPVYNIKRLMIQRELAKDPKLKDDDWSRFLPTFTKKNVKRRTPFQIQKQRAKTSDERKQEDAHDSSKPKTSSSSSSSTKKRKTYTPFPPPQTPSKVDLQLESGEYFLSPHAKRAKQLAEKRVQSMEQTRIKRLQRQQEFVPPSNMGTSIETTATTTTTNKEVATDEIQRLKNKFSGKKMGKSISSKRDKREKTSDYIRGGMK